MSRARNNQWIRVGVNILLLLAAPVAHVLIYALLSGLTFLGLGSLDINPMMEPYGYITKIAASAIAAFVVSFGIFYFVQWPWWITMPILVLLFNLQRRFDFGISVAEVFATLSALVLVLRIRASGKDANVGTYPNAASK